MDFKSIQQQVSKIVTDPKTSVAAYLNLHKSLAVSDGDIPDYVRKPRLAFLSNFTVQGLPEVMQVRGAFYNIWPATYLAPYNQCAQEILNPESNLYRFTPDLVYLFIDAKTLPDLKSLTGLIDQLLLRTKARIIVFNPEAAQLYANNRQIVVFDFPAWLKTTGHDADWYTKYAELGDLRLAPNAFIDLAEMLLGYAVAVSGATRKCVVVDLDNTLWSGVLGEDGLSKIVINRPLQEYLLDLFNRGVILAINSHNNLDEALQAIEVHPDMLLRKKHFAAWRINWGDKVSNMLALAKELNLGVDSFVFIDDDLFQQNLIRETLPEVSVISAQNQQALIDLVRHYVGFSVLELTEEDIRRGQMYTEERGRRELQANLKTLDEFLKELNLEVEIQPVGEATLPRAAQLTQKTNQFNLTTRRYTEEQLKDFLANGGLAWVVQATDRFGDYGIIGLAMVKPQETKWHVDNFLLSCRILGRGVEKYLVNHLISETKNNGVKMISAEYRPTSKNTQTENFWESAAFRLIEKTDQYRFYNYDIHDV